MLLRPRSKFPLGIYNPKELGSFLQRQVTRRRPVAGTKALTKLAVTIKVRASPICFWPPLEPPESSQVRYVLLYIVHGAG
jgi:hypothetical protein